MKTLSFKQNKFTIKVLSEQRILIFGRFLLGETNITEAEFFTSVKEKLTSFNFEEIHCTIEYLNGSAEKELLYFLKALRREGTDQTIYWYYEGDDDALLDLGAHYQTMLSGYAFELKEVKDIILIKLEHISSPIN